MEAIKSCSVENCQDVAGARGLCKKHYKRWQRHGNVEHNSRPKVIAGENNKEHPLYKKWRSITRREGKQEVCTRWHLFENFIKDVIEIPEGLSILKRKDPSKPFGPDNYHWSDSKVSFASSVKRRVSGPIPKTASSSEAPRVLGKKSSGTHKKYHRTRELNLMKKYGITLDQYQGMLESQDSVCAICKKPETIFQGNLAVDHCHTTGKIRGLLCSKCNTTLGKVSDSIEILQAAIDYLNFHNQA